MKGFNFIHSSKALHCHIKHQILFEMEKKKKNGSPYPLTLALLPLPVGNKSRGNQNTCKDKQRRTPYKGQGDKKNWTTTAAAHKHHTPHTLSNQLLKARGWLNLDEELTYDELSITALWLAPQCNLGRLATIEHPRHHQQHGGHNSWWKTRNWRFCKEW